MQYAVIQSGGKQYQVQVGQTLALETMGVHSGPVVFDQVLLLVDEDKVEVGMPYIPGLKVTATVLQEVKADKIQVFKYKSKSRYRKLRGHRQKHAQVKITDIGTPVGAKHVSPVKSKKVAAKKLATKKTVK